VLNYTVERGRIQLFLGRRTLINVVAGDNCTSSCGTPPVITTVAPVVLVFRCRVVTMPDNAIPTAERFCSIEKQVKNINLKCKNVRV
jgi:hypothetical protein